MAWIVQPRQAILSPSASVQSIPSKPTAGTRHGVIAVHERRAGGLTGRTADAGRDLAPAARRLFLVRFARAEPGRAGDGQEAQQSADSALAHRMPRCRGRVSCPRYAAAIGTAA